MISEAIALTARLSEHFKIPKPELAIYSGDKSLYHSASRTIFLASHPWRGIIDSVLHEFSHALAYARQPVQSDEHGAQFQVTLAEVVTYHFGDVRKYGWETEYEAVRDFLATRKNP